MKWLSKKSLLICLTLLMLVVVVVSIIVTMGGEYGAGGLDYGAGH